MINIYNTQRKVKIPQEFKESLKKFLEDVLSSEGKGQLEEINVIFVNNSRIREINREFLKRDRPTDVISFNLGNVGEIYISAWVAEEKAKEYNWDVYFELTRYALHGLLHILGYDHEKEDDAMIMEKKEDYYLTKFEETHYGRRKH